jgi:tyrosinase
MFLRREVRSLEDDTLKYYAVAVQAMKERSPTDHTSWWYQAAIHGSEESPRPLYNQCIHGSWYFPPWHRMYLYYFERIVRDAVIQNGGPDDWALPYWNYGIDAAHASMPEAFYKPAGEANPLYVQQRRQGIPPSRPGINEGGRIPQQIGSDGLALACEIYPGTLPRQLGGGTTKPRFKWSEAGQLEELPHNLVHDAIGGGGWMSSFEQAAKDPIFWLHHCNIDRIWAQWNGPAEASHPNPNDPTWRGQKFKFFDVDGSEVTRSVGEVLDIEANLDYTYDVLPSPRPEDPKAAAPPDSPPAEEEIEPVVASAADGDPKVVAASEEPVTLTGEAEAVPVAIDDRAQEEVQEASRRSDPRRLYLNIENIEGETNPGTMYGVYLNLPENPDEEALEKHYAGAVSFFGIEHGKDPRKDEGAHQLRYVLEVGELLRTLGNGEEYGEGDVKVSFRPLGLEPPKATAKEGRRAAMAAPAVPAPADEPPVEIGRVSLSVGE